MQGDSRVLVAGGPVQPEGTDLFAIRIQALDRSESARKRLGGSKVP